MFQPVQPAPNTPTPRTWTAPGYVIQQTEPSRFVLKDLSANRTYAFTTFDGAVGAAPARGRVH